MILVLSRFVPFFFIVVDAVPLPHHNTRAIILIFSHTAAAFTAPRRVRVFMCKSRINAFPPCSTAGSVCC
uniref:Putative secreted protein n=1 Tax=Anopheles triannulatus TaxID=58253 RepID=A0A2M4B1C8_9DIPT